MLITEHRFVYRRVHDLKRDAGLGVNGNDLGRIEHANPHFSNRRRRLANFGRKRAIRTIATFPHYARFGLIFLFHFSTSLSEKEKARAFLGMTGAGFISAGVRPAYFFAPLSSGFGSAFGILPEMSRSTFARASTVFSSIIGSHVHV